MESIIVGVVLVGVVFLITFAYKEWKDKQRKENPEKEKEKPLVYTSKKGSLYFYLFLLTLVIFFIVMFIMWKFQ